MANLFKSNKFPAGLFIGASLLIFILFALFLLTIKLKIYSSGWLTLKPSHQLYSGQYQDQSDLLVTKLPTAEDLLDGPIISPDDPVLGQTGAPLTIIYFADFNCSFCQRQEQVIKQIIGQYQDKILLVWKDYPETNQLSPSFQAAQAARCAQEQDQFWAYHDQLFLNKNSFNRDKFIALAEQLKLNQNLFIDCFDSGRTRELVLNNIEEANLLQISGIPFTYVNKQELLGQSSPEELRKMVEAELAKAESFDF